MADPVPEHNFSVSCVEKPVTVPEEQRVKKAQLEAGGAEVIRQSAQRGGGDTENTSKNHHPGRSCADAATFPAPPRCFLNAFNTQLGQDDKKIRYAQPWFQRRPSERSPGSLLGSGQAPRRRGLQRFGQSESSSKHQGDPHQHPGAALFNCCSHAPLFPRGLTPSSVTPELNL